MTQSDDDHTCKHFTEDWVDPKNATWNQVKGIAGENELLRALEDVARSLNVEAPALLGEPDATSDPTMIARTNGYPDCHLEVNGLHYLFEVRNLCYYKQPGGWGKYHHEFYQQPPKWFQKTVIDRKWYEPRYPVRSSQISKRVNGRVVKEYTRWVPENGSISSQKVTPVYVSTVRSLATTVERMVYEFFGNRAIFIDHPLLSPKMYVDSEDEACSEETRDNLLVLLIRIITDDRTERQRADQSSKR